MDIYEKMKELGVELPAAPAKGGLYSSCKKFGGNLFYGTSDLIRTTAHAREMVK